MRARNIKPGFFINAELSEVCFATRLLFIGLWCYADREGRFEWKPKQIKAVIFPYDKVDIEKLLSNLMSLHVITCHASIGYIENFKKHQNPHPHEAKSILPPKPEQNQCHDMSLDVTECNADSLIPDSLIPDSNNIGDKSPPPSSLFDLWNEKISSPKATKLSTSRSTKCRLRLKDMPLEEWGKVFDIINSTPFLRGENKQGWRADFDWIIDNSTNALKVLEGKYECAGTGSISHSNVDKVFAIGGDI